MIAGIAPPPDLKVSEWADAYRKLSKESSSEPGQWRTSRAPYQREILDAVNDPGVERVVIMSSAQVGKTELLLNSIGYYVDYDPSPILVLQPTLEMAQTFSKDRLAPMVRDTPALTKKFGDPKSRSSGNTMLHKTFAGGHVTMAGSNSPASLASRPIRVVLCDEIDRYPVSAGTEGDPVNLAIKRTLTFWNRKIILVSTPTIKGKSRIESAYEDSTQEVYTLKCKRCGNHQQIVRRNIEHETKAGELVAVLSQCEACREILPESDWKKDPGIWQANAEHRNTRGFHLNEYVSPWRRWLDIELDFLQAKKSPETLKTFVNTSLGETWEEDGEKLDDSSLYARRERYVAQVPAGGLVVTCAVDVQDDRLEAGVEAWGEGEENYKIDLKIFHGNPAKPDIWNRLDEYLLSTFEHESGEQMRIACTVIDSGGHHTKEVYKFCKAREARRVYAIKGKGGDGVPVVSRPSRNNLGRALLFTIGVDTAKASIYSKLQILEPGPGYVHFPIGDLFDEEYFLQITAEQIVTRYRRGFAYRAWEKIRARNEAFDLAVYNLAALLILNPNFKRLARLFCVDPDPDGEGEAQQQAKPAAESSKAQAAKKSKIKRKRSRGKGGYAKSW